MVTIAHSEEEKQVELNRRSLAITQALKAAGWRFDATTSAYHRGEVRVYVQSGCQHIQRTLRLTVEAYVQYIVKTVNTVAEVMYDSLDVEVNETLEQLHAAIEKAEAAVNLQAA